MHSLHGNQEHPSRVSMQGEVSNSNEMTKYTSDCELGKTTYITNVTSRRILPCLLDERREIEQVQFGRNR